ncbi:MAG: hypothetical protein FWF90_05415 [Promicromonosporaceae bacterium]|nr:hypothetical protein [Promicromonosporaceae bacterium]
MTSTARDQQIRRLEHACGCTAGMVVMLLAVTGYVVHNVQVSSDASLVTLIAVGAGVGLAGAVVGKLAGLFWARARLARLRRTQPDGAREHASERLHR